MTLRIGFVGAGGIAKVHADIVGKQDGVDIVGVVEPDDGRASEFRRLTGAERYDSCVKLAADVDGIYLVTPPNVRLSLIEEIVSAGGKPVFCEKPLAGTVPDAEAIAAVVDRSGIPFMMGFSRRFYDPVNALRKVVTDGTVGRVLQVHSTRVGRSGVREGNWRTDAEQMVGMTVESVSHDIDILRHVVGDVTVARGEVVGSRPRFRGFDDNVAATLRFASGAIGILQVSWSSTIAFNRRLIVGTEGSVLAEGPDMWSMTSLRWRRFDEGEGSVEFPEEAGGDRGRVGETVAFLDVVRRGSTPPVDVHDGVATVRVSHDILSSSSLDMHAWSGPTHPEGK